ncbi:SRPBCC family protein [Enterobacteriaceae bacterium LUAb1]
MFTWSFAQQVATDATPAQIWEMWQDAATWPCWDRELDWVRLNGAFEVGTAGEMQPKGAPVVKFKLTEITREKSFADEAKLPLTRLIFKHEYLSSHNPNLPAQIRHSVTMTGLFAPLFGKVIGSKIKLHLREAMQELSQRALTGNKQAS